MENSNRLELPEAHSYAFKSCLAYRMCEWQAIQLPLLLSSPKASTFQGSIK